MITTEVKQKIVAAIKERRTNFQSDAKMSVYLGISNAQFSRVVNKGQLDNVISDAQFFNIARKLEVVLNSSYEIRIAKTEVFEFITSQLAACQEHSMSGLFCDLADIGKTFAAKWYARNQKNVVYVDGSQLKSKQKLIRFIAKELGLNNTGRYADVYADLVYYMNSNPGILVIVDEAGDLSYDAWLELKALWNATEGCVGWYMLGADGLRAKIESNLSRRKVGYAEMFRRYGSRYQSIVPSGRQDRDQFKMRAVAEIAKANGVTNIKEFWARTENGSLTRAYHEIKKLKRAA